VDTYGSLESICGVGLGKTAVEQGDAMSSNGVAELHRPRAGLMLGAVREARTPQI
jgi:hypothetical protein